MVAPAPAIHAEANREARLVLLRLQARERIKRTDASLRKVVRALARFADAHTPRNTQHH